MRSQVICDPSSSTKEESAGTIADDWVMVGDQPVVAMNNAVIPSEISVVVSSDNLEETSSIKFGKKKTVP